LQSPSFPSDYSLHRISSTFSVQSFFSYLPFSGIRQKFHLRKTEDGIYIF
jgi:hypothetical protein